MQEDPDPGAYYSELAAAYIRGSFADVPDGDVREILAFGKSRGLKLHRFKKTMSLPRIRSVIGALHGIMPETLIDIGTGRGVFLWPLLDAFPELKVTVVEKDDRRVGHLKAVRAGGLERLEVLDQSAEALPFDAAAFDVATVLEVLEHQDDPTLIAEEAVRVASRFVIASVPSKEDDNPEHIQLFTGETLRDLLLAAGAKSVNTEYVLNHIIAVART